VRAEEMSMPLSRAICILLAVLLAGLPGTALAQGARPGLGPNAGTPIGRPLVLPEGLKIAGPLVAPEWKRLANGTSVYECPDGSRFPAQKTYVQSCVPACNWAPGTAHMAFPPGLIIVTAAEGFQNGLLVERVVVRVPGKNCNANTNGQPNENKELERKRRLAPDGAVWIPVPAYCLNLAKNPTASESVYTLGPVSTDPGIVAILKLVANRRARNVKEKDAIQAAVYSATEPGRSLAERHRKVLLEIPQVVPAGGS
jgi:hypothetical protein